MQIADRVRIWQIHPPIRHASSQIGEAAPALDPPILKTRIFMDFADAADLRVRVGLRVKWTPLPFVRVDSVGSNHDWGIGMFKILVCPIQLATQPI